MAKEKKQNYSNQNINNKSNRNIQKESPHNPRGNPKHPKNSNPRDGNRKKGNFGPSNQYQLPPIKPRNAPANQLPTIPNPTHTSSFKKVITAKSDQVQEAITHLKALETLLNSYEELEMDENSNIKSLVEQILRKKLREND